MFETLPVAEPSLNAQGWHATPNLLDLSGQFAHHLATAGVRFDDDAGRWKKSVGEISETLCDRQMWELARGWLLDVSRMKTADLRRNANPWAEGPTWWDLMSFSAVRDLVSLAEGVNV